MRYNNNYEKETEVYRMSIISLVIIIILFVVGFLYLAIKKQSLNKLNKAMTSGNYDEVLVLSEQKQYKKFIGNFNCDLYRLKALTNKGNDAVLKEELNKTLEANYSDDEKMQLLEIYFHSFLNKEDREYCEHLMTYIHQIANAGFIKYNEWAFEVICNNRSDLIKVMEDAIDNKEIERFGVGVSAYMLGIQYYRLENYSGANSYFTSCIGCFHPKSLYIGKANAWLEKIATETK